MSAIMDNNTKETLRSERGAATIIENTIVIPIVVVVIMALFSMGYTLYERAVLEACTARAANYIVKTIEDPNYESITTTNATADINEISGFNSTWTLKSQPYRYLFGLVTNKNIDDSYAKELVQKNVMYLKSDSRFITGTDNLTVTVRQTGGAFPKVTVTTTMRAGIAALPFLSLPESMNLTATSTVYVNQPAEFIRNVDFAAEIVEKVGNALGVTDKINQIKEKLTSFKSKFK